MENERRRSTRATIPLDAVIEVSDAFFYAETRDLSDVGLSLLTKKPFPVGTRLRVVMGRPPDLPRIDLEGVVKWLREGDGIGLEFTVLSSEDKSSITAFLRSFPGQQNPVD